MSVVPQKNFSLDLDREMYLILCSGKRGVFAPGRKHVSERERYPGAGPGGNHSEMFLKCGARLSLATGRGREDCRVSLEVNGSDLCT